MSHLLHALTLLDANSYPWPFVSYDDARTDTENIRLFNGGGKNARGPSPIHLLRTTNGRVLDEDVRRGIWIISSRNRL